MKAEIDWSGVLRISAENGLEAFALSRFVGEAYVSLDPLQSHPCGRELAVWKGSRILIDASHDASQP